MRNPRNPGWENGSGVMFAFSMVGEAILRVFFISGLCLMLAPLALAWWEIACMGRRSRLKYRLSTLFVIVGYVAVVLGVIRWLHIDGAGVIVVGLLVAGAMAVLWLIGFAVADIIGRKRIAKRRDQVVLLQEVPAPPPQAIARTIIQSR